MIEAYSGDVMADQDQQQRRRQRSTAPALGNLVTEMDTEGKTDEQNWADFQGWFEKQSAATAQSIETLNMKIGDFKSSLEELYAQKQELTTQIQRLNGEIEATQGQIDTATDKRNGEHEAFVAEQQDFDNSITACQKATDLLAQHYGESPEVVKPGFLSLLQTSQITILSQARARGIPVSPELVSALQQGSTSKGPFDTYQSNPGGVNIVDQMKVLAQTFAEDK